MFARRVTAVLALVSTGGCSHAVDVVTAYPAARGTAGALDVVLNDPSRAVSVTVDGALVAERAYTRRVHVDGVPAGTARVRVATGGRCEQGAATEQDVIVEPGVTATLVLPGPEPNVACQVANGLFYVGEEVGMVAIAILLGESVRGHHR